MCTVGYNLDMRKNKRSTFTCHCFLLLLFGIVSLAVLLKEIFILMINCPSQDQEVHMHNTRYAFTHLKPFIDVVTSSHTFYTLPNFFHLYFRLTYSDLCLRIPESKFRQCLLTTLAVLFRLMCSYYEIMGFQLDDKVNSHSYYLIQYTIWLFLV